MNVKLVEKISKKGDKYKVLELELVPGYIKYIFLDKAELMLLENEIQHRK